ncbi:uncharacterized protein LOC135838208 [Planococcus citri]|uniref:uncharacterized protein LOC135838208 n=1 Tax=Planococcus citri TaxID=170843 RepID=UPI0031F8627C
MQKRDPNCMKITRKLRTPDSELTKRERLAKGQLAKRYEIHEINGREFLMFRYKDDSIVPVLPDELFADTMMYIHDIFGHVGANKLTQIFRRFYYSSNSKHYARYLTSACLACKSNKSYGIKKPVEFSFVEAHCLADVLSVDILGPIANSSNEPRYLLVAKDIFSGKIWLQLMLDIKQETVADCMLTIINNIKDLGYKIRKINTDNAVQFRNSRWNQTLTKQKITVGNSTPYNPQSNPVERSMRMIGERLRLKINFDCRGAYSHEGWHHYTKEVEDEINNCPNEVGILPNDLWEINDFVLNLPIDRVPINAHYELKELRKTARNKQVPSITIEELKSTKLDMLNDVYTASDGHVWVWVDGACANNGDEDAIAGVGICWHPEGSKNISERINHPNYTNTNNLAEIMALKIAMETMITHGVTKLMIFTDSQYVTLAINSECDRWVENKWKNNSGKPVHHKEIFEEVIKLKQQFDEFHLCHTYARKTDYGNFTADQLARKAVYTEEVDTARIDLMSYHQALIHLNKEKRAIKHQNDEQKFNEKRGDLRLHKPGELVMITNHRQSSADKLASAKLYVKQNGPYAIVKRAGRNCYEIQNLKEKKDRTLISVRQIVTYLTLHQLEAFRKEPKLRSKFDKRSLHQKIRAFWKHKDLLENFVNEEYDKKVANKKRRKQSEYDKIRRKLKTSLSTNEQKDFETTLEKTIPDVKERESVKREAEQRYNLRKRNSAINYDEDNAIIRINPRLTKKKLTMNSIILEILSETQRETFTKSFETDWNYVPTHTEWAIRHYRRFRRKETAV